MCCIKQRLRCAIKGSGFLFSNHNSPFVLNTTTPVQLNVQNKSCFFFNISSPSTHSDWIHAKITKVCGWKLKWIWTKTFYSSFNQFQSFQTCHFLEIHFSPYNNRESLFVFVYFLFCISKGWHVCFCQSMRKSVQTLKKKVSFILFVAIVW